MTPPAWLLDAVSKFRFSNWYLSHVIQNFKIKQKTFEKTCLIMMKRAINSKIENKMRPCLIAEKEFLWQRSNVWVLLAFTLIPLQDCFMHEKHGFSSEFALNWAMLSRFLWFVRESSPFNLVAVGNSQMLVNYNNPQKDYQKTTAYFFTGYFLDISNNLYCST